MEFLASKSDTSRSLHVFQRALNNFEILFLASTNTYKPETSLTILFARKVSRSALKVELTRFFIGKSDKEHKLIFSKHLKQNIRKKRKIYL